MNETKEEIKKSGATFTPPRLAEFLADKISQYLDKSDVTILDPSCGDGSLLAAMGSTLKEDGIDFSIRGTDINERYLANSARSLENLFGPEKVKLTESDFLESFDIEHLKRNLFSDSFASSKSSSDNPDVIIANPPYVRTQLLGSDYSQLIAKKFSLKGKIDLYFPFLKAMTYSLNYGGILGVITSNRYLHTKSGEEIRKFLQENFEILEVIDLGDTKLFDAAVLPAIFIGRRAKAPVNTAARFQKIYEEFALDLEGVSQYPDVCDALEEDATGIVLAKDRKFRITKGTVRFENLKANNWILLDEEEEKYIARIEKRALFKIKDHFKVRVGIKTTADKVFIKKSWDALGSEKPEKSLIYDLISQENIEAWAVSDETTLQILYPHFNDNGRKGTVEINDYPKASKYLKGHYDVLNGREYLIKAGRKWYEIWVPQNPALWAHPKVVFPDISVEPRFCFDDTGKLVNGNCYWIVAEKKEDVDKLLFIQGICNSRLMLRYHSLMYNNKLYSGRKRYFSQFVENYPIPGFDSAHFSEIVDLVRQLNSGKVDNRHPLIDKLNFLVNCIYLGDQGV